MKNYKLFLRHLLASIGLTSALVTIFATISKNIAKDLSDNSECSLILIAIICIAYSCYRTRSKEKIKIIISERTTLNIKYGDIFDQEGVIVIPCNNYFDTIVNNEIISIETLHGEFIEKYFKDDIPFLDKQISEQTKDIPFIINEKRTQGKKESYPLGTCIKVKNKNNKEFILFSLTNFNEENRARVTNLEYQEVMIKLLDYIENKSQGSKISIPLAGTGHSGLRTKKQCALEYLIIAMRIKEDLTLINGINIILSKEQKDYINLNIVDYYYNIVE
ncbi:hypothetical protein C0Z01_20825 [Photobacterium kishitanii]|uniref:macro domain-containing protein n=1 Tax=Photobacterium kishitanii TaxID=318456 RepID=UPI0007EFB147|nr:macro domain-containing protein [Photobacterium kishitanii]OBU24830.1 hypothetical protein AYY22_21105 [Photobacterium kishitanii]PSW65614.1 hypothetical protein C0Z01_20825 [Photobacterium kishitanii]